jgi:hypothetical protein
VSQRKNIPIIDVAAPAMRHAVRRVLFYPPDQLTVASRNTLTDEVR